jgi:hypothetical protein
MLRQTALSFLMVVIGLILLLPGACALFFMTAGGFGTDASLVMLWVVCLLISAGGIWLLVKALR